MSADADWSDFAHAVADKYTVVSEIGRGGMAVVLLARDARHQRQVALKVFRPELSAAIANDRFEREIQIGARLNHPHIVPLFDSGAAAGHLFYVMPFLRGETLRQRLDRDGTLDVALAVRLTVEVCGALEYAHRSGVVHRDIKPENILLSEAHAVVADFGIAYALDSAASDRLTGLGLSVGTPAYMSPEQAFGEGDIDGRSDQYSLACVLFELLTGKPPFVAPTAMAVIARQISQVAPLLGASRPELPELLERALERALEKAPDARFASASDFARALEGIAVTVTVPSSRDSVLVLDFMNVSADPAVQWLAGGIAETVGFDLKRLSSLRLVHREKLTRTLARRGQPVVSEEDALGVAKSLGARWVVWGGYQRVGDRIRITPQLGDVQSGEITSASKIDGAMDHVFEMQDQIVDDLLRLLGVQVAVQREQVTRAQTKTLSAYELYARARQLQNEFTPTSIMASRQLLLEAIERDDHYALAYSGLGFSYAFGYISTSNPTDLASAIVHLERAIELDPGLGEAYTWLSYACFRAGRLDEAVALSQRATELEPDFHFAHYFHGVALTAASELGAERWSMRGQAVQSMLTAASLEPGSQSTYGMLVDLYLSNGQYEAAAAPARKALELETGAGRTSIAFIGALTLDASVAARLGDATKAAKQFERAVEIYSGSSHMLAAFFVASSHLGVGELARRRGSFDEALISARRAAALCHEHPEHIGTGYATVCARLLAAKASMALGIASEARSELAAAEQLLRERTGYAFSWGIGLNEAWVRFDCASAYAASGKVDLAMHWLESAYQACWNDYPSLRSDPSFARMQALPQLAAFVKRCEARGPHPEFNAGLDAVTPMSRG